MQATVAMTAKWFAIGANPELDDYWQILVCGMSSYLPRKNTMLRYLRTGPFVPPMVVSGIGHLIVTDQMRAALEGVSGVSTFRPVVKEKIVRLDWSNWKVTEDIREFRPFHEPEDILIQSQHDPKLASELGDLHEVVLKRDGAIQEDFDDDGNYLVKFRRPPKKAYDIFGAKTPSDYDIPVATRHFVESLTSDVSRWLHFTPIE